MKEEYPVLQWEEKRRPEPIRYFPAQLKEQYGEAKEGWFNKIFWGDNIQVIGHLLKEYRGKIDLIKGCFTKIGKTAFVNWEAGI